MITNARSLTLSDLRQQFGLRLESGDRFFEQWLSQAPPLEPAEQVALERLARNYEYLSQEEPPLEEIVKLVVVSPLLDLAGFYQPPFRVKTEVATTLEVADDSEAAVIQGKVDVLVIQESFWVLVIESKPARLDVTAGIPQALAYLLSTPTAQSQLYSMITNGREVLFLKLDRGTSWDKNRTAQPPQYSRSSTYRLLENTQERHAVLQGLRKIGTLLSLPQ